MLYILAILLPPLAVLLSGKPFQAILNVFLCILFWIPGMLHAIFVVHNHYADVRTKRMIEATQQAAETQAQATLAAARITAAAAANPQAQQGTTTTDGT